MYLIYYRIKYMRTDTVHGKYLVLLIFHSTPHNDVLVRSPYTLHIPFSQYLEEWTDMGKATEVKGRWTGFGGSWCWHQKVELLSKEGWFLSKPRGGKWFSHQAGQANGMGTASRQCVWVTAPFDKGNGRKLFKREAQL